MAILRCRKGDVRRIRRSTLRRAIEKGDVRLSRLIPPEIPSIETARVADELRARLLHLRAETSAMQESIDVVRRQLEAQGFGLRRDITEAMTVVQSNLEKANRDIREKDYDTAWRDLDNADAELAKLRTVWGR